MSRSPFRYSQQLMRCAVLTVASAAFMAGLFSTAASAAGGTRLRLKDAFLRPSAIAETLFVVYEPTPKLATAAQKIRPP